MHVGMSAIFQNPGGNAGDPDLDAGVYALEYELADKAESLGFDSLWSVEHHLNGYAMCPDPLKFLMYFAGRTEKVKLGTMVVVMPWHTPLRIAEDASVLDQVSGGRLILGCGRGVAKQEFEGFGVDQNDARALLVEGIDAVKKGLDTGRIDYQGSVVKQSPVQVRPKPTRSFKGRIFGSAQSPETYELFGKLGIGILFIPGQKSWDDVAKDLGVYRDTYRKTHGEEAPAPIFAGWTFVDEDEKRAQELGYKYIRGYVDSALDHYNVGGAHMKTLKGYENYAKAVEEARAAGITEDMSKDYFVSNHIYGTPDQCVARISEIREKLGACAFLGVFNYAGMPADEARRNQALFAAKVLPRLKAIAPGMDIGSPTPALEAAA
jgi:alkanesulfonate monooxygenase SsuD/methylene tetrahydromethanopterin reductase-like flavin-dependent oxidoreductase (luciferase family)